MKGVERLILYMQSLVVSARGNVVSLSLKRAKRALGAESKAEEAALKAALEALAGLGLLQKTPGRKPRYVLQRGSPLWKALEQDCTELLTVLVDSHKSHKAARPPLRASKKDRKADSPIHMAEKRRRSRGLTTESPGMNA